MKSATSIFKTFAVLIAVFLLASCAPSLQFPGQMFDSQAEVNQWLQGLAGKTPAEQARIAEQVWGDPTKSKNLRMRAAYILATRPSQQTGIAQSSLNSQYDQSTPQQRVTMEQTLYADLNTADNKTLTALARAISASREKQFPYSLTLWAAAKRGLLTDSPAIVKRLSVPGLFADPTITGVSSFPTATSATSGCVALLLPQSGTASSIATKISNGAEAARQELQAQGKIWEVITINTESPDWISRVQNLPATCITVGGPIQSSRYTEALNAGVDKTHALFTFLPRIPNSAEEGTRAWRFFSSPEDQIDAVLDAAYTDMGITQFGVFAPDDRYGQGMAALFQEVAIRRGYGVTTGYYPAKDIKGWVKASASFVNYRKPEKGAIPAINVPFEAIFLPDSWKNMDMIISTLHYHGAHKKIMLGSSLWEQGLANAAGMNPTTFALTIFPVSYDEHLHTPAFQNLAQALAVNQTKPDDWAILGYDFVKMAAALGLSSQSGASAVNQRLQTLSVDYAGAPVTWDASGKAHRKLFIAQPARNGQVPYDADKFRQYRNLSNAPLPNQAQDTAQMQNAQNAQDAATSQALDNLINNITEKKN